MTSTIKILFLAAEAEPFVKIGGLADVAGSLPQALRSIPIESPQQTKLDIRLVIPFHRAIHAEAKTLFPVAKLTVIRKGCILPAQVFGISSSGMPVYFINGEPISSASSVYSTNLAVDREKFTFFSIAVLELIRHLDWKPDIVHANDWHTALALYALRSRSDFPELARIRTVMTIHNLPYMGGDATDELSAYGFQPLNNEFLPKWAQTQPLPLGLWSADAIVPVSPTYAQEILTPHFGCGLDPFLATCTNKLTGILNGLDEKYWNPETDNTLSEQYNVDTLPTRVANKSALQQTLKLKVDQKVPLLVMIGRIDQQKGLDIAFETLRLMRKLDWQFILLGSGDLQLEETARNLQAKFPDRVRVIIRYDQALSRQLYGGGDMLLMPSRYEPCGLAQMIAMHYGCVPVVHATGGLKDTVQQGKNGFLFEESTTESMLEGLDRALTAYSRPEQWQKIQYNGMKEDFSWSSSARRYASIYYSLVSSS